MNPTPLDFSLWIAAEEDCSSPIISRSFSIDKPTEFATLYITAFGFFEAYINGKPVTSYKFLPVQSDFEKRDTEKFLYPIKDIFTYRTYYYEFDVKDLLNCGENLLEIHLGNGWYRQTERTIEGNMCYGNLLKTIYRLDFEDSFLTSDGSEFWCESEIRYNNIFTGEIHDKTFKSTEKKAVTVCPSPETELTAAQGTPDKIIRTITPSLIATVGDKKIYDTGENISGVARIFTKGGFGEKITLRFAENINADNTLNFTSAGCDYTCQSGIPQIMTDTLICDGTETVFEPKFVWHAFRYFEIEGPVEHVEILVIHSDCDVTSYFNSSSEGLNFLYEAFIRSQLGNMHGSVPTDCPHRERLGYTGDGQICAKSAMMLLDSREFYKKWIRDILDCQNIENGHVQHTAPFMGGGGGPGGWGCAIVFVPFEYYKQFGEIEMLKQCFEPICRWFDYLITRLDNYLITREEDGGWCLGEWSTLENLGLPEAFVNTCLFVKALQISFEIAQIIGKEAEVARYKELEPLLISAIRENFEDEEGNYCNSSNGAELFALNIGICDKNKVKQIANKYAELGYIGTGILASPLLFEQLFSNGYSQVALSLLESEKLGTYLYMKRHGATTLWESWSGGGSHNHPMLGSPVSCLFTSILGCKQPNDSYGYKKLHIKPEIPETLEFAEGSIKTVNGTVKISFKQSNGFVFFDIQLSESIEATFEFNSQSIILTPQEQYYKGNDFEINYTILKS